ncbi:uncharacterized protein P174DRAFT_490926 [Aspergillus novofumigatus IBT 16806]|uniref:Uncharacterized protein n=1 Tax=Aspergillus novofumigatus (strain IBT 16806) TaxID=1392255 RepID=A0A2I1BRX5_ASPN1|nr:uncharacterized protein P174DRAFT_490926 [Aspergillus novofumigatus IBT 16806]PKX88170.1 hypothetical protein P174DRAFT_490926 [Aspergillus novofumigatus IBT 16806]
MAGYKVNCISGYSLEVGADGGAAWYGTPHATFVGARATTVVITLSSGTIGSFAKERSGLF